MPRSKVQSPGKINCKIVACGSCNWSAMIQHNVLWSIQPQLHVIDIRQFIKNKALWMLLAILS